MNHFCAMPAGFFISEIESRLQLYCSKRTMLNGEVGKQTVWKGWPIRDSGRDGHIYHMKKTKTVTKSELNNSVWV